MECVVNEASPCGAQREEIQAAAAVPGTTDGDPGERYTSTHDSFLRRDLQRRRRRLIRQRQGLSSSDKVIVEVK